MVDWLGGWVGGVKVCVLRLDGWLVGWVVGWYVCARVVVGWCVSV